MKRIVILLALNSICLTALFSQELTQTIRGQVADVESLSSLPGANVIIVGTDPIKGAVTDLEGNFRIDNVPVGRVTLAITFIGYEDRVLNDILVTSGKEVVLEIKLQESLMKMDEIVVVANKDKSEIANEMALISARGFTVEETKRYAGSFNDPARMVSSYAGVAGDASGNNYIVVRGNSPKGVMWRLEGIEIPNPNHFSDEGATGGPINALNSSMLSDSEFYTGAFAPEYGNALSGVFDMKLRKGNNESREYRLSAGLLGTEANIEGPFSKNGKSSFLANYRYSTLAMLDNLGLVDFDGIPKYQDASFKMHFPTRQLGAISVFGLGGISNIEEKLYEDENEEILERIGIYGSHMGVLGITQYLPVNNDSYFQNSVALSRNGSGYDGFEPNESGDLEQLYTVSLEKKSIRASNTYNNKINARHNVQVGAIFTNHSFDFFDQYYDENEDAMITDQDREGSAQHYQGFVSWKYRMAEELILVSGAHFQKVSLNDEISFEPRASLRWQYTPRQAFSAGFGVHGKMESLINYFGIVTDENGVQSMPNTHLELTKARHYVLGYENKLGANLLLKAEAYYQQLYNIPVENDVNSSYSLLNQVEWFADKDLVNEGTGSNLGLELTLERYFKDNYFFMVTGSIYDSKYKALDGIERDTRFNWKYAGNLLFGKEFELNADVTKKKVFGVNAKISLIGARRFTPIDLEASIADNEAVFNEDKAFTQRGDNVFIPNLSLTYRIDRKKTSQELKIDVQNFTNNSARLYNYFDENSQSIEYDRQLSLLPVIMYTIQF